MSSESMRPSTMSCLDSATRLFAHLARRHVRDDGAIIGPDPGVRLNLRAGRFVKSYLRWLPWPDQYYYLQGQAYWILDNLDLARLTGDDAHNRYALRCAEVVASRQTEDGYWGYPGGEWRGRIVTVEGYFGALGLLAAHTQCFRRFDTSRQIDENATDSRFLDGAKRWYCYMVDKVGFQSYDGESLAVNYFANAGRGLVPNNSTLALWFVAELSQAAGDAEYMQYAPAMMNFLARCQLDSGELPYSIGSEEGPGREHYLCFQYNAYQFLDLAEYYRITGDEQCLSVMKRLAGFLATGLTAEGDARYDCMKPRPAIHYFTSAAAAALKRAAEMGLCDFAPAERGYDRLLAVQRADGGFDYSWGDYGFLSDRRSYPRNQAMILRHLIMGVEN